MKTLTEILNESILDENVLIDPANNPFLKLKSFRDENLMKHKDEIISILEALPLPKSSKLKNTNYTFDINERQKKLYIENDGETVCTIMIDPAHSEYADNRDIIIMYFSTSYFHTNAMKTYAKKWNLNQYFDGGDYLGYSDYRDHRYNTLYI